MLAVHCLLCAAAALANQAAPESGQLATLDGVVLNAATKEPIRKAHVTLAMRSANPQSPELIATTDDTGHFRFAALSAARYRLTVAKAGFLEGAYGANQPDDAGSLLSVAAGALMQDLAIQLFPAAIISGRVLDIDGDPVPNNEVTLWSQTRRHGHASNSPSARSTANQSGEYSFPDLSPGTYYVSASAGAWGSAARQISVDSSGRATKLRDLSTFYPAALSLADSEAITLESGQQRPGIDIRIQHALALSVKGKVAGIIAPVTNYSLNATVDDGAGWTSEAANLLSNGEFVFPELPPGKHRLLLSEVGKNGQQLVGKTDITLTDMDVTGVVITPFKPAQLRVRVVLDGEEDKSLTTGSVRLTPERPSGDVRDGLMQFQAQNGAFVFDAITPGRYAIWSNAAQNAYLKSLQSGNVSLDPGSIDLADGVALDLVMVLSKGVATATGDVAISQDQAEHSIHVLLLSARPIEPFEEKIRSAVLDQSLHFSITNLPPGKYAAFATEDDDSNLWNNDEFLKLVQSEGASFELHEKDQASLHLKLISKEETDRIRKQLGL